MLPEVLLELGCHGPLVMDLTFIFKIISGIKYNILQELDYYYIYFCLIKYIVHDLLRTHILKLKFDCCCYRVLWHVCKDFKLIDSFDF